jgi:hypothetical protein
LNADKIALFMGDFGRDSACGGCQKSGCHDLGLSEEAVQDLKFEFQDISPEIWSVGLMVANLIGL